MDPVIKVEEKEVKPAKVITVKCEYVSRTSSHFTHKEKEYNLNMGFIYDLPADCPMVKNLLAQGRLIKK